MLWKQRHGLNDPMCRTAMPDAAVDFRCRCGHEWEAASFWETGKLWLVNDDDRLCEICGGEGEKV